MADEYEYPRHERHHHRRENDEKFYDGPPPRRDEGSDYGYQQPSRRGDYEERPPRLQSEYEGGYSSGPYGQPAPFGGEAGYGNRHARRQEGGYEEGGYSSGPYGQPAPYGGEAGYGGQRRPVVQTEVYQETYPTDEGIAQTRVEVTRHKREEEVAGFGGLAAGAFAMYEAHEVKIDPEHARRHRLEEEIAGASAVGAEGFAFYEHHEKKKSKENLNDYEEKLEEQMGVKKHHHHHGFFG